jgi:hypothetical protein
MLPVPEASLRDVEICTENTSPDKYLVGFEVEIMRNSLLMLFAKGSNLLDQNIRNSASPTCVILCLKPAEAQISVQVEF